MISDQDTTFLILSGKYYIFDIGVKAVGHWKLRGIYYVDKSSTTGKSILELFEDDVTYSIDDSNNIIVSIYQLGEHNYLCAFDMDDYRQDDLQVSISKIWETVFNDIR